MTYLAGAKDGTCSLLATPINKSDRARDSLPICSYLGIQGLLNVAYTRDIKLKTYTKLNPYMGG